ncbi:hypothetical protein COW53_00755 [bacterium CG17_big_fil_post_rev_8_21_14_2_50_64_8]|nr:MAG: hypothetical protein COW53_00755 [bacterium CG17_big_fil_post_rev_8_21_14_2_50_64_8]
MSQPSDQSHFEARDPVTSGTVERAEALSALQIAESILQQSGLPPCAIVNDSFNTVYIHGKTGRYLEPSEGRASLNIVEMARPGLKTDLAVALRQVVTSQQAVTRRNIRIDGDQGDVVVNLSVKPILDHTSVPGLIMVVFEDAAKAGKPQKSRAPESRENKKPKRVADLEQALLHSNESLQTIVEELETSNEELRSTNEELQSTNEELQSTNEELETSKEELQSLNEESVVINAELQARIDELTHSNDDLKNLLDSAEIATVFLDTELKIRRYTAPTLDIIPLEATDVGRPLKHLATELVDVDLAEQSELVLDDLAVREFLAHTKDHRHFLIRLRPYRTTTNVIAGVVITLEDVTKRQRTAEALQQSEKRLRTLFELSNDSILLIDAQTERIQECNHAAFERLGYSRDEFLSLTVPTLETPESPDTISTHIAKIVESGEDEFESKLKSKDGTTHEVLIKAKVISIGERNFVMATISDLSTG